MRTYYQAKTAYIADHNRKEFVQPERRLNALAALEKSLEQKFPEALGDPRLFENISEIYFIKLCECLKGSSLSDAEKSVITGLYKFAK